MKGLNLRVFRNWEFFVNLGLPLILLPLLFIPDENVVGVGNDARPSTKFKCAYVLILMAVFWMVEALPLAITSLLPMVLFPLLGVMDTSKVSVSYMKETNMMFIAGLIIALSIEYSNLHRRIALKVMKTMGCSPPRLTFGLMLVTAVLSMFMSNTATAAMITPVAMAALEEIYPKPVDDGPRRRRPSMFKERSEVDFEALVAKAKAHRSKSLQLKLHNQQMSIKMDPEASEVTTKFINNVDFEMQLEDTNAAKRKDMKKMLLFSVCLSSNIGGTGFLTGTASNLVFQELIKPVNVGQGGKYVDISFATWMAYNIPPMVLNLLISWVYLTVIYIGMPQWVYFWRKNKQLQPDDEVNKESVAKVAKVLEEKYKALGKMTFHELAVFVLFISVVLLWLFREPKFMKGWAEHVSNADVGDSTAALTIVLLLFIIPRDLGAFFGLGDKASVAKTPPLLDWKYCQLNMPWGIVLLMGGGFALSSAVGYSGLSEWLGNQLHSVESLPHELILVIVMLLTATLTEVASNAACVNVVIPILIALSESLNIHPLFLTLPATVTCSYAFLLPVATPPNAIIFAAGGGDFSIFEMFKTLLLPNLICIAVVFTFHLTYGNLIFSFDSYEYPNKSNVLSSLVSNFTTGVS